MSAMGPARRGGARLAGVCAALLLVAVALGTLPGCSRGCSVKPVQCSRLPERAAPQAAPRLAEPPAVSEGRIYLDLSQSMRGFIGGGEDGVGFTLLQRGLDGILDEAFATAGVPSPSLVGFGSELRRDLPPLPAFVVESGGSSPRKRYSEVQTDLGAAVRDIRRAPRTLSVVVTDGAQDLRVAGAGSVGPGFVRTALVRLIHDELIQRGFGVWLVGAMSDFGDCYYNVRADRQGRVGRCIEVRRRPAYFWVFSRDLGKGRELVRYLVRELRSESGVGEGASVEALELSPGALPKVRLRPAAGEDLARLKDLDRGRLSTVAGWRDDESFPGATAACVRIPWIPGQAVQLPVVLDLSPGAPDLADLVLPAAVWSAALEPPPALSSLHVEEERASEGRGRPLLLELSHDEAMGLEPGGAVEIPVVLRADFSAGLERSWVGRWSTRDDSSSEKVEGKTLYLADIVEGILAEQLPEPRAAACLHLEVMRK